MKRCPNCGGDLNAPHLAVDACECERTFRYHWTLETWGYGDSPGEAFADALDSYRGGKKPPPHNAEHVVLRCAECGGDQRQDDVNPCRCRVTFEEIKHGLVELAKAKKVEEFADAQARLRSPLDWLKARLCWYEHYPQDPTSEDVTMDLATIRDLIESGNMRTDPEAACEVCGHPESRVGSLSSNARHAMVCDECAEGER